MNFSSLFKNIRFYILLFSAVLSLGIFGFMQFGSPRLEITKLTQAYALTAITYLYLALLTTPVTTTFTFLPFRGLYLKARRAIGVSAFYFALLHACFGFFGELGGFAGLPFLDLQYLLAITLSFMALVILALMASTSFDYWVERLGFVKWKLLHRFVYLAAILVTIHALMLGSHFTNLFSLIPQIFSTALVILLLLEAKRLDKFVERRFFLDPQTQTSDYPRFGIVVVLTAVITGTYLLAPLFDQSAVSPLGIHATHIQIAKQNQAGSQANSAIPALAGDRTLRYNVRFDHPPLVQPNQPTDLSFTVSWAGSGAPTYFFDFIYSKKIHLIVVDDFLTYFSHIHPEQDKNSFKITTQFPNPGKYHLYTNFQPKGAIEQQFGFTLETSGSAIASSSAQVDFNHTKTFGGFQVKLEPDSLSAAKINSGTQTMKFTLTDVATNQPVTNLKPYLSAFGHLTMIESQTYDFIHVHPASLAVPKDTDTNGPTVEFLPLAFYGPIRPGTYRAFAEFNPGGKLLTTDFTIRVAD